MLARGLSSISERYAQWYASINVAGAGGGGVSAFAPVGETQMMIATGMLMCLIPLIILYLVAQRAFVESLSQTGIKM
jgi:multiple sugar transport system permease protein